VDLLAAAEGSGGVYQNLVHGFNTTGTGGCHKQVSRFEVRIRCCRIILDVMASFGGVERLP
jgi:hypothetical protein